MDGTYQCNKIILNNTSQQQLKITHILKQKAPYAKKCVIRLRNAIASTMCLYEE